MPQAHAIPLLPCLSQPSFSLGDLRHASKHYLLICVCVVLKIFELFFLYRKKRKHNLSVTEEKKFSLLCILSQTSIHMTCATAVCASHIGTMSRMKAFRAMVRSACVSEDAFPLTCRVSFEPKLKVVAEKVINDLLKEFCNKTETAYERLTVHVKDKKISQMRGYKYLSERIDRDTWIVFTVTMICGMSCDHWLSVKLY
jgi:hypothetical protein